jgi:hypothetical protein
MSQSVGEAMIAAVRASSATGPSAPSASASASASGSEVESGLSRAGAREEVRAVLVSEERGRGAVEVEVGEVMEEVVPASALVLVLVLRGVLSVVL